MPLVLQAALWGGFAGTALLFGAMIGYFLDLPRRVSAGVMAFGVGVLIACLSFNLLEEALQLGGLGPTVAGFVLGAVLFASANALLAAYGGKGRKSSHGPTKSAAGAATASLGIALGSLLDGIPEATAIGTSLLDGEGVALVTVFAIFISNVPEGLSSTVGMKAAGFSKHFIFGLWAGVATACLMSAWLGFAVIGALGPQWTAIAVASAAGAILVMIVDTMIPEAFDELHGLSGPLAATGFLLTFVATQLG